MGWRVLATMMRGLKSRRAIPREMLMLYSDGRLRVEGGVGLEEILRRCDIGCQMKGH